MTLTHNVSSKVWAFLLVSRVEFMVMGIPVIAISALLAASRPYDLMGDNAVRLVLLTTVWYLAYWISSQVNCIADYELDKTYKSRLPRSIDILNGPREPVKKSCGSCLLIGHRAGDHVQVMDDRRTSEVEEVLAHALVAGSASLPVPDVRQGVFYAYPLP